MKSTISTLMRQVYPFNELLKQRGHRIKFADEISLAKGRDPSQSKEQSILFFTAHKCASVYVGEIVRSLTASAGMTPINVESYYSEALSKTSSSLSTTEKQQFKSLFQPMGYCYGPIRETEWPLPDLSQYRTLLMLRDPRDVLTSLYFSVAYSHTVVDNQIGEKLLKNREAAQVKSIDSWVIEHASTFLNRYEFYCEHLLPSPDVCFLKYEQMVTDFSGWFEALNQFLALADVSKPLQAKILQEANFDVEENVNAHKRQVQPGDHKRKLQPDTIVQLDSMFESVLVALNYEIERR